MDGELRDPAGRERAIARLAGRQHGVVTRRQLRSAGLSPDAINNRLQTGRLHRLHRGVYLLGHRSASQHAHEIAAVLASGPEAALSHRGAAHTWDLLLYQAQSRMHDVTVPARNPNTRSGVRLHRVSVLDRRDVTSYRRISIVTPARALLDLAAIVPERELERALAQAYAKRKASPSAVEAVLLRNGRRAGTGALRQLLQASSSPALTRSEAEERLLEIRRTGLPQPHTNQRLGPYEVDFLWRAKRLVVEVDGFQCHSSRIAFERDRLRDAELQSHGYRVMRVTWNQIVEQPAATLGRIARALDAASA